MEVIRLLNRQPILQFELAGRHSRHPRSRINGCVAVQTIVADLHAIAIHHRIAHVVECEPLEAPQGMDVRFIVNNSAAQRLPLLLTGNRRRRWRQQARIQVVDIGIPGTHGGIGPDIAVNNIHCRLQR